MKANIYHLTLKTILQHKYFFYAISWFLTNNVLNIIFLKIYNEDIKIQCADNFKQCCYILFTSLMVDYIKQVFITGIKANMQCFIYYILLKKENI